MAGPPGEPSSVSRHRAYRQRRRRSAQRHAGDLFTSLPAATQLPARVETDDVDLRYRHQPGSDWCGTHDPAKAAAREEARDDKRRAQAAAAYDRSPLRKVERLEKEVVRLRALIVRIHVVPDYDHGAGLLYDSMGDEAGWVVERDAAFDRKPEVKP